VDVELTASSKGKQTLTTDALKAWYQRYGFVDEPGFDPALGYMIRFRGVKKVSGVEAPEEVWTEFDADLTKARTTFGEADCRTGCDSDYPMSDLAIEFGVVKSNPCHNPGGSSTGGRFCSTGSSSSGGSAKPTQRVFTGKVVETKAKLSKLEVGAIGEQMVIDYLRSQGKRDARTMNVRVNNAPVDLLQNHTAIEVKTGLVSNGKGAQQWRATIGQPGVKETQWLAKASSKSKAAWNERKAQAILDRKQQALKQISKELGRKVTGSTFALILNPDRKQADMFRFNGFHLRIGWNSPQTSKAYVGTFAYGN
jgi:hypothetical protein